MHEPGDVPIALGRVGVARVENPVADGLELVRGEWLGAVGHRHAGLCRAVRCRSPGEELLPCQRAGGKDHDRLGGHDDRVTVEPHRATAVRRLGKALCIEGQPGGAHACLIQLRILQKPCDVELSARWQHGVHRCRSRRENGGRDVIQQHWNPSHQRQSRNGPELARRWTPRRTTQPPLCEGASNSTRQCIHVSSLLSSLPDSTTLANVICRHRCRTDPRPEGHGERTSTADDNLLSISTSTRASRADGQQRDHALRVVIRAAGRRICTAEDVPPGREVDDQCRGLACIRPMTVGQDARRIWS